MTSRTGHVMATAALQPVEERLRQAVTVAAAAKTELVDGQPQPTSPQPACVASSDSKVIHSSFITPEGDTKQKMRITQHTNSAIENLKTKSRYS